MNPSKSKPRVAEKSGKSKRQGVFGMARGEQYRVYWMQ
jgi:hypothetical protein